MRINFSKTLRGKEYPQDLLKKLPEDTYGDYSSRIEAFLEKFQYNLQALDERLTTGIQDRLTSKGFDVQRTSSATFYSANPVSISVSLNSKLNNLDGRVGADYRFFNNIDKKKIGDRVIPRKNLLFMKRSDQVIPIYQEVPNVIVKGKVQYDWFKEYDPSPVISALSEEGYASSVVQTIDELKEIAAIAKSKRDSEIESMLRRAKEEGRRQGSTSNDDSSALLPLGIGLAIGLALGDD